VRALPQLFRHPYVKELVGLSMSAGKDFVSGKQKSAILEIFCGRVFNHKWAWMNRIKTKNEETSNILGKAEN
jgi:hypothetical protein